MMNNKLLATIVIIVLALLGFWYFSQQNVQAPTGDQMMDESEEMENEDGETASEATVVYTDDGFNPSVVTVEQGGTVHFVNQSSSVFWPASAMHPTHMLYPGSDIELCATAQAGTLFDACGNIGVSETWSFTFNEAGEWAYHNHLNATHFGRVVVE